MNTTKIIALSLFIVTLLAGCRTPRYITEQFIKTEIEQHNPGQFSSIKLYSIFQGKTYGGHTYLELTGYKYNNTKGLVIGADRYYKARPRYARDETLTGNAYMVTLTADECQMILDNYEILKSKIRNENPKNHEAIYHDLTINENLFISYSCRPGSSSGTYISLWMFDEKFVIDSDDFIKKLKKFASY